MRLSRVERIIMANQFRILEALYPDEADSYAEQRDALERGYEGHYDDIFRTVYPDEHVLSADQCHEVVDILQMFDQLQISFEHLADKAEINPDDLVFSGFDGNNETTLMAYARYYCKHDGGRYQGLKGTGDFNSHFPALGTYQRMLLEYRRLTQGRHNVLSAEQIKDVIRAQYPHR